ncbi:MAG: twin-arginine translocase TatA/TatE family subunit [Crocinitomicaceae bacterium]|nr:twin-arginine translocase TatA/TatE family subunit [Crocinitomicaceae bacterium]
MLLIFNDIAGSEIMLILVFVLIFFGSKSIPGLAKTLGKTMYQVKQASSEIQNEIKKSGANIKGDLNLTGILRETQEDIRRPLDQMAVDIENAVKYQAPNKHVPLENGDSQVVDETVEITDDQKNTPVVTPSKTAESLDSKEGQPTDKVD